MGRHSWVFTANRCGPLSKFCAFFLTRRTVHICIKDPGIDVGICIALRSAVHLSLPFSVQYMYGTRYKKTVYFESIPSNVLYLNFVPCGEQKKPYMHCVLRIHDILRSGTRFSKSMNRNYDQGNLDQKHAKHIEVFTWMAYRPVISNFLFWLCGLP